MRRTLWTPTTILVLIAIALSIELPSMFEMGYYAFHVLVLVVVTTAIWTLNRAAYHDRRESILLFLALGYCAFHFGMIPVYLTSKNSIEILGFNLIYWYENSQLMIPAYSLALVYLTGLVSSIQLPIARIRHITQTKTDKTSTPTLASIAFFFMMGSIAIWFYIVFTTGFSSYDVLLKGLETSGRGALIGLIHTGIGISFVLSVIMSERRRATLTSYCLWALLAFPLGLRGEVAFPALLAISLLCTQGRLKLNWYKIAYLAIAFLAFSSAVAVLRVSTTQETIQGSVSVVRGIAELGGSIRPAYEVINWLNAGDQLQWGKTYYAPFERTLIGLVPFAERIPAELDDRLMNVLINKRAGPYGFSISAEAFYNFGFIGCFVLGLLSGWGARFAGRIADRKIFRPVALALIFALLIHIRQSFVAAYGAFMISLALLSIIWFTERWLRQK